MTWVLLSTSYTPPDKDIEYWLTSNLKNEMVTRLKKLIAGL